MSDLIKEWTTALRYKNYQEWDPTYIQKLIENLNQSKWKLSYHIQPQSGLLNDPNGFSYFNKQWHMFYQAYPMGPVHGVKSWAHMISDDLIHWSYEGLALLPDTEYDSHGVYSGSAFPVDDKLFLMYTGNVRDKDWNRHAYQNGAWMNSDNSMTKIDQPLIPEPPVGYTQDFRDPQVFAYDGHYYATIGAQDTDNNGQIVLYSSQNLTDWSFLGQLQYTPEQMGFMVECPNIIFVNNQPVLIFCPQGLDKKVLDYNNIYPNTYITGSAFNPQTVTIEDASDLIHLDEGFDVYATQAINAPDGRALCVSWIGLPEIAYPTDIEGWAHCLSLVKELSIKDGHLYQYPVKETISLRKNERSLTGNLNSTTTLLAENHSNAYELELTISKDESGTLTLLADKNHTSGLTLSFDTCGGTITVDRSKVGAAFATEYSSIRTATIPKNTDLKLNIFVDHSVVEIYMNDGYRVLTSRVFPSENQTNLFISGEKHTSYTGKIWALDTAIHN